MVVAGTWERNAIKLEKIESWSLGAASKESKWQLKILPKAQLDCKRVRTAVRHEGTKGKGLEVLVRSTSIVSGAQPCRPGLWRKILQGI